MAFHHSKKLRCCIQFDHIPERLILFAHSYAGRIARTLESLRHARLCHVVYLQAVIAEPGRSPREVQPADGAERYRFSRATRRTGQCLPRQTSPSALQSWTRNSLPVDPKPTC